MSIKLGTTLISGNTKLYGSTGQNTDGSMTQKAATDAFLTGITSSDVTTALGFTPSNTNLSNLTSTGKILVANLGMPGSSYTNLTLGASGSTYNPPKNGYLCVRKQSNAVGQYLLMRTSNISILGENTTSGNGVAMVMPVRKNDTVTIEYSLGGTTRIYRFVPAVGEN